MFGKYARWFFYNGGANYMPVADLAAATAWYREKFGVKQLNIELDDGEGCVALGFDDESCLFVLGPQGESSGELTARLFLRTSTNPGITCFRRELTCRARSSKTPKGLASSRSAMLKATRFG